ncbi:MAG: AbrB/MazE/SpoVT family DNA-binding domain-containing protein [Succinivibrio sp.]
MSESLFVNDARVMAKGQVTIPKKIRAILGIESGDRVSFVVSGNEVKIVNSAVYAMMQLQKQMNGAGKKSRPTNRG